MRASKMSSPNGDLPERHAAVVRRNLALTKHSESLLVEHREEQFDQEPILEHSPAQRDRVDTGAIAQRTTRRHDEVRDSAVKLIRNERAFNPCAEVIDDSANNSCGVAPRPLISVVSHITLCGQTFECNRGFAFVRDPLSEAAEGGNRIE